MTLLQVRDALKALEGSTETARLDVMRPLEVTHPCSELCFNPVSPEELRARCVCWETGGERDTCKEVCV